MSLFILTMASLPSEHNIVLDIACRGADEPLAYRSNGLHARDDTSAYIYNTRPRAPLVDIYILYYRQIHIAVDFS